jgi:N-glycosylase/DNA lyase
LVIRASSFFGEYFLMMFDVAAPDFDLAMTLDSGQVFHWEETGSGFVGAIGDRAVYVEQRGETLRLKMEGGAPATPGSQELAPPVGTFIAHYFALDHPLAEICASFPDDPVMNAAEEFCRGLRIIRQPKWECLATFICSSMKQIAHIRQISRKLRERFGRARKIDPPSPRLRRGEAIVVHTFPTAARLAQSSEKELRECALGYRAKNLINTARLVASNEVDLDAWSALSDVDLQKRLCQLPGVGAKVANCVMLFAYERLGAFPIDVWIERVLREKYFPRVRKLNAAQLRAFTQEYFREHGGYAQQYLFHHARMASRKPAVVRDFSTPLEMTREGARMHKTRNGGRRAVGAKKVGHDSACPSRKPLFVTTQRA